MFAYLVPTLQRLHPFTRGVDCKIRILKSTLLMSGCNLHQILTRDKIYEHLILSITINAPSLILAL